MTENLTEQEKALEKIVMTRLVRLSAAVYGIVFGLMLGAGILIATLLLVIRGGSVVGPNLALLGQFFIGYTVTYTGSLIGFAYGFLTGFIIGYSIATVYNWIIDRRPIKNP
ncbi:MAG: hypothetical protein IT313_10495 [Anaerolineales bacterium]|nr:hypothetical protein [Anaerolineales bacterium]